MRFKTTLIVFLIFCLPLWDSFTNAESLYPKRYQQDLMDKLNEVRLGGNVKPLVVDPELCELAEKISVEKELLYPNKLDENLMANIEYKHYLKSYVQYFMLTSSPLDMFVELSENAGVSLGGLEYAESYTKISGNKYILDKNITHGCIGYSSGEEGYKPFAHFIGAKKGNNIVMIIQKFLDIIF